MLRKSKEIRNALAACCLASLGALCAGEAKALNVTVSGTTYDIKFYSGSFDGVNTANSDALKSTSTAPWWGDASKAVSFRDAYATAAAGTYPFDKTSGALDLLAFSFEETTNDDGDPANKAAVKLDDGRTSNGYTMLNNATQVSNPLITTHYAYVDTSGSGGSGGGSTAAPEIDANALTKALFLLFAFGVWQVATRSRQDIA